MSTRELSIREIERTRDDDEPSIDLQPVARPTASETVKRQLLELQLRMATCSINHEYARMEYDDLKDVERRDELLDYMHECRSKYLEARTELEAYDPYALADFEADLMRQKQTTLGCYQA